VLDVCERRGFTLMEMILVLAIVVALGALVVPALQGTMDDQRLLKAAELIRAQWAQARVKAMNTGQIHVYRYEAGSGNYAIEPWQGDADATEASTSTTTATSTDSPSSVSNTASADARTAEALGVPGRLLPSGITFYSGTSASDSRSAAVEQTPGTASSPTAANQSRPIVFYPDGTATDARLVLTNERAFVEVQLRGLTGFSRASELLAQEELTP
jgi:prepilin-type N-terminal cleavage/methylation domain-containing protein